MTALPHAWMKHWEGILLTFNFLVGPLWPPFPLQDLRKAINVLTEEKSACARTIEELEQKLAEQQRLMMQKTDVQYELEKDVLRLTGDLARSEASVAEQQHKFQQEIAQLTADVSKHIARNSELEQDVRHLETTLDEKARTGNESLQEASDQMASLTKELKEHKKCKLDLEGQVESLKGELARKEESVQALMKEVGSCKGAQLEKVQQMSKLEDEMTRMRLLEVNRNAEVPVNPIGTPPPPPPVHSFPCPIIGADTVCRGDRLRPAVSRLHSLCAW